MVNKSICNLCDHIYNLLWTGSSWGSQYRVPCCGRSAVQYSSPLPGTWGKESVLTDKVSVNGYVCLHCSVQNWIFLHTWFLGRKVERVKNLAFWFLRYLWDLHNAKQISQDRALHQQSASETVSEPALNEFIWVSLYMGKENSLSWLKGGAKVWSTDS